MWSRGRSSEKAHARDAVLVACDPPGHPSAGRALQSGFDHEHARVSSSSASCVGLFPVSAQGLVVFKGGGRHGGRREEGVLVGGRLGAQPLQRLLARHRREGELRRILLFFVSFKRSGVCLFCGIGGRFCVWLWVWGVLVFLVSIGLSVADFVHQSYEGLIPLI